MLLCAFESFEFTTVIVDELTEVLHSYVLINEAMDASFGGV
jgi:hypothetical protein